jgi:hypothetical protein
MIAIVCLACWPTACTQHNWRGLSARTITVDDFTPATSQLTPVNSKPAAASPSAGTSANQSGVTGASTAPTTLANGTAAATSPPAVAAQSLNPGDQLIIDSLVGQVSGRPIFADALLAPIAEQLRSERAQSATPREFELRAKRIVDNRLRDVVLNELFLAESESSLTQQQQQGLLAFLRNLRERTIAESLGSVSQREQQLQAEQGLTLDQYLAARKDEVLIQTLLMQKVQPRVIVSWKDVQREYNRNKERFNPPALVTLKRIRLSTITQAKLIEQVKGRLQRGDSFDAVAASLDSSSVRTLDALPMKSADVSDIDIIDAYKPFLKGLREGQTTQPIAQQNDTVWLHVAKIERQPRRSIYDVQRQLINELERRRREEQQQKYIRSLFEKGIYDQLDQMSQRVLTVALLRYGRESRR